MDFKDFSKCETFHQLLESKLRSFKVLAGGIGCILESCASENHTVCIDRTYLKLNVVLNECGRAAFGTKSKRKVEIPGWNEHVKDAHEQYRNAFLQWRRENSPRQGDIACAMRTLRARFKLALRWCRRNEESLRAQALQINFRVRTPLGFGKKSAQ